MLPARHNWLRQAPRTLAGPSSLSPGRADISVHRQCEISARAVGNVRVRGKALLVVLALVAFCLRVPGEGNSSSISGEYARAKASYEAQPQSAEAAWQLGRACFNIGQIATNKTERAELAEQGIAACRKGLAQQTDSAPLHYYLALNLGKLAETRGLSALKLVDQLEEELLATIALDPRFDQAGPERTLGMLYRDAPSIISVGSRAKAKKHLVRAVELAPDYPENRLELIRAHIKWNDRPAARRELQALDKTWDKAKAVFAGEKWGADWVNWEAELDEFKKKLEEASKLESPRH